MTTVFDVNAGKLIDKTKDSLKSVDALKPTEWIKFAKTKATADKPPEDDDFWYTRAAAIMRTLYINGKPTGVERLRVKYGGRKDTGSKPSRFVKGTGNLIRKILQQLESAGLVKKTEISGKKGRILTKKGKSYLDKIAASLAKEEK